MNEKKYYTAIGLFVISGFAALLFLALRVSGGGVFYGTDPSYTIKAEFHNVGRLKTQSKVALSGVTIGRVSAIELDPVSFQATVSLEILKKYNTLPDDSRFSIVTAGLLGDNYIAVYPGFSEESFKNGTMVDSSQTTSAIVLEELIAKLFTAFSSSKSENASQDSRAIEH